jgi:tRNA nucleotidyltransferase (CCA-adding enzyme)
VEGSWIEPINSLFYDINTNQVDDWTEQGLNHLQLGIIATPMNSLATLLDNPLRILRAIRFAAQLEFVMNSSLKRAAMDARVRRALQRKVSKDCIGKEMDAIFSTHDPTRTPI